MCKIMRFAPLRKLTEEQRQLAAENVGLAYAVVWRCFRDSILIPMDDLQGIALLSLCRAALDFDPSRGVPFCTHAWAQIKRGILDELRRAQAFRSRIEKRGFQYVACYMKHAPEHAVNVALDAQTARSLLLPKDWYLLMRVYGGRESLDELAQRRGVTVSAIRKKVARIVERLRRRLDCAG